MNKILLTLALLILVSSVGINIYMFIQNNKDKEQRIKDDIFIDTQLAQVLDLIEIQNNNQLVTNQLIEQSIRNSKKLQIKNDEIKKAVSSIPNTVHVNELYRDITRYRDSLKN